MAVKTSKENDSEVSKDVLLHQIFQEIHDENSEHGDESHIEKITPAPKTKLSKIREMQKKRQWVIIVILMITIIYVLFYTDIASTQTTKDQGESNIYTIPKANQIVKQKKEPVVLDVLKENSKTDHVIEETNPILEVQESPLEEKMPQTERERAKEALFMQMQN